MMDAADRSPAERLAAAVFGGDAGEVAALARARPELRASLDRPIEGGHFGETPLMAALRMGHLDVADALLAAGADIDARSDWWAGSFGVLDRDDAPVEFLLARGAGVNAYAAARHGLLDRLRAIVASVPDEVHMRGGDGQTPLHVARSIEVAEFLLARGADIDALDVDHESTPAQYLVRSRHDVARHLVARGARTDLLLAAAIGDGARVRELLAADPGTVRMRVDARWFPMRNPDAGGTIYQWTLGTDMSAHEVAHAFGRADVLALLMQASPADLQLSESAQVGDGTRFAALAAAHPELARALATEAAPRLLRAAGAGDLAAVRLMLGLGWPADARDTRAVTALHLAAWNGDAAMARLLAARGAPLDVGDTTFGGTPLGWAIYGSRHAENRARGDYAGVVEALLDAGAPAPANVGERDASAAVLAVLRRARPSAP